MNSLRPLTPLEKKIIDKLLEHPFQGNEQIKQQVKFCMASPTGDLDNYGSIYLKTSSKVRAKVTSRVPVEGITYDVDNVEVDIILHVVDGYVNELEIVKADGSDLKAPLNPDKIRVTSREL
jgi:hypothetical protein